MAKDPEGQSIKARKKQQSEKAANEMDARDAKAFGADLLLC